MGRLNSRITVHGTFHVSNRIFDFHVAVFVPVSADVLPVPAASQPGGGFFRFSMLDNPGLGHVFDMFFELIFSPHVVRNTQIRGRLSSVLHQLCADIIHNRTLRPQVFDQSVLNVICVVLNRLVSLDGSYERVNNAHLGAQTASVRCALCYGVWAVQMGVN